MVNIFIGVDPGKSGAIVAINWKGEPTALWPLKNMNFHDIHAAFTFLKGLEPEQMSAIIERVHAMPKQGVSSTFKFGMSFGSLLSSLCAPPAIKYETVTPHGWQQALGCLSKGDKNVTKARAQALFPNITVTHAIADALLLAEYGRRHGPWKLGGEE